MPPAPLLKKTDRSISPLAESRFQSPSTSSSCPPKRPILLLLSSEMGRLLAYLGSRQTTEAHRSLAIPSSDLLMSFTIWPTTRCLWPRPTSTPRMTMSKKFRRGLVGCQMQAWCRIRSLVPAVKSTLESQGSPEQQLQERSFQKHQLGQRYTCLAGCGWQRWLDLAGAPESKQLWRPVILQAPVFSFIQSLIAGLNAGLPDALMHCSKLWSRSLGCHEDQCRPMAHLWHKTHVYFLEDSTVVRA